MGEKEQRNTNILTSTVYKREQADRTKRMREMVGRVVTSKPLHRITGIREDAYSGEYWITTSR